VAGYRRVDVEAVCALSLVLQPYAQAARLRPDDAQRHPQPPGGPRHRLALDYDRGRHNDEMIS